HNPQTHDPAGGQWMDVEDLAERMLSNPLQRGLTLSGGEPFAQPEACAELAQRVRSQGKDVWVYSGYTFEELYASGSAGVRALLEACDVLVDGRFVLAQRSLALRFRGSANQRLINLPRSLAAGQATPWIDPAQARAPEPLLRRAAGQ
nr:4Fe-4S single cluster domain-containing protein [Clostridia bacterium]